MKLLIFIFSCCFIYSGFSLAGSNPANKNTGLPPGFKIDDAKLIIESPKDGSTVKPGETVTVKVKVPPNSHAESVMLMSNIDVQSSNSPPHIFQLQIPVYQVGEVMISVIGTNKHKKTYTDHTTVTLNAVPVSKLKKIKLDQPEYWISSSLGLDFRTIGVEGIYDDGVIRNLDSRDINFKYTIKDPDVALIEGDRIKGVKDGKTVLNVSYGSLRTAALIIVSDVDGPPLILRPNDVASGHVGDTISFTVRAKDPEGQPVMWSAKHLPSGATFIDNGNGEGLFTWVVTNENAGYYDTEFIASDGRLNSSTSVSMRGFVPQSLPQKPKAGSNKFRKRKERNNTKTYAGSRKKRGGGIPAVVVNVNENLPPEYKMDLSKYKFYVPSYATKVSLNNNDKYKRNIRTMSYTIDTFETNMKINVEEFTREIKANFISQNWTLERETFQNKKPAYGKITIWRAVFKRDNNVWLHYNVTAKPINEALPDQFNLSVRAQMSSGKGDLVIKSKPVDWSKVPPSKRPYLGM